MGIFFVLSAVIIGLANDLSDYSVSKDTYLASGGLAMGLSGVGIVLTLVEVGLLAARRLKPAFHLSSACVKSVIWLFWFFLNIASSASVGRSSALDIVLSLIVVLCCIGQVIYGSIIVHRVRKGFYRSSGSGNDQGYAAAATTDGHGDNGNGYGYGNHGAAEMYAYPVKGTSQDGRV